MKKSPVTPLTLKIIRVIKRIPKGKVATYGQIAGLAGTPGAARRVTWVLHSCSKKYKLPWHRVVNSRGEISFPKLSTSYNRQKRLLVAEGVMFSENNLIQLSKFKWSL